MTGTKDSAMSAYKWNYGTSDTSAAWSNVSSWLIGASPATTYPQISDTATLGGVGSSHTYTVTYDLASSTISGLTINNKAATLSFAAHTQLTVNGTTNLSSAGTINISGN